jgi:hypothetical protein
MKFHLPPAIRPSPNGAPDRPAFNSAICHQNDIGSKLSGKKVLDGKLASSPLLALQQVDDLLLVVNSARSAEFDEVIGKRSPTCSADMRTSGRRSCSSSW